MDDGRASLRRIRLRYGSTCTSCGLDMPKGWWAWWDPAASQVWCANCRPSVPPAVELELAAPLPPAGPGASAQREFDRRHARRIAKVTTAHPRLGRLVLAVTEDPQSTRAWQRGAEGERRVAASLEQAAGTVQTLHDRRIPPTRCNIDHITMAPTGVYVIDAKMYRGAVAVKSVGGLFQRRQVVFVGRRKCDDDVEGLTWQAQQVVECLAAAGMESVPVHRALCLVEAEWPLFAPRSFDGVLLEGPKSIRKRVSQGGPLAPAVIAQVAAVLGAAFPPA